MGGEFGEQSADDVRSKAVLSPAEFADDVVVVDLGDGDVDTSHRSARAGVGHWEGHLCKG